MIHFKCQSCGNAIRVADEAAGKKGKCKRCGKTVQVPSVKETEGVELEEAENPPTESPAGPPGPPPPQGQATSAQRLELQGRQGKSVIVDGATVKIIKKATLLATEREKTLPIRNVTSVEVKKPGALAAGFIQFSIAGGKSHDSSFTFTGGAFDAAQDENSVLFADQPTYEIALRIKQYVETYQEKAPAGPAVMSVADEISKLKALMDDGTISREEFDAQRRRLLQP